MEIIPQEMGRRPQHLQHLEIFTSNSFFYQF